MGVGSGTEGANERCAPHTPLRSGFFLSPPVVWGEILSSRGQRESRCPRFFLFQMGAACIPHVAPDSFLFLFLFRTGAAYVAPFLFVSNGGGVCRPVPFLFRTGAAYVAPCLSFSNGGSVHATRRPLFLSVSNGGA